jgi:opacity protein-like surface antigen
MKKLLILLTLSFFLSSLSAQDTQTQEESTPVRFTFGTNMLIDNQTVESPYKGGLQLQIQHRFSLIENYHNLYGIYGSANTRLALTYGITDKLMVGVGTTKDYQMQDIEWKYRILSQTEDGKMPVSLSYFGNVVADLRTSEAFGPEESFRNIHRFSYFTQLILARKFTEKISAQIAPSFIYFNSVPRYSDTQGYKNVNFGLSAGARANLFGNHSLIIEYDQLLTKQDLDVQPKPNLAFGWEINTATHTFQVFAANYNQIISQRNLVFNTNDFTSGGYLFGFNITVRF